MQTSESHADRVRSEQTDSRWKSAYSRVVNSPQGPPGKLRGVIFALITMSDPFGRCWASQDSIANYAHVKVRTLRRYLDELEISGWLKKMPHTFRSLALEQAHFGLPLPDRDDNGISPDVLQLCRHHQPAVEAMELRVVVPSQNGQKLRPKTSNGAPVNLADDPEIKSDPTGNRRERDPEQSTPVLSFEDNKGWAAICGAYNIHYREVYGARATCSMPLDIAEQVGGHIADLANLLLERLRQRSAPEISFTDAVQRIADAAVGAWLRTRDEFLVKCNHALKAIRIDLPKFGKNAVDTILHELAPRAAVKATPTAQNVVNFAEYLKGEHAPKSQEGPAKPAEIITKPNERVEEPVTPKATERPDLGVTEHVAPRETEAMPRTTSEQPSQTTDAQTTIQAYVPDNLESEQAARKTKLNGGNTKPTTMKSHNFPDVFDIKYGNRGAVLVLPHTTKANSKDCIQGLLPEKPEPMDLLRALGAPKWCDLALAAELLIGPLPAPQLLKTIQSLRLDENVMTSARIRAKVFQTIYAGASS